LKVASQGQAGVAQHAFFLSQALWPVISFPHWGSRHVIVANIAKTD
jgi:hypothetical protein